MSIGKDALVNLVGLSRLGCGTRASLYRERIREHAAEDGSALLAECLTIRELSRVASWVDFGAVSEMVAQSEEYRAGRKDVVYLAARASALHDEWDAMHVLDEALYAIRDLYRMDAPSVYQMRLAEHTAALVAIIARASDCQVASAVARADSLRETIRASRAAEIAAEQYEQIEEDRA